MMIKINSSQTNTFNYFVHIFNYFSSFESELFISEKLNITMTIMILKIKFLYFFSRLHEKLNKYSNKMQ